jgi:phosphotransferase system HPr (HPr) family protein
MITINVKISNQLGIHARTAAKLVRTAAAYKCSIDGIKDGKKYDLKNVRGAITLNGKYGDDLTIQLNGVDELEASKCLKQLFIDNFGEN